MTAFVALLRAVNVGGTGKLPMGELVRLCESAGFCSVSTYIASGNVVFSSRETEARVKARLEQALQSYANPLPWRVRKTRRRARAHVGRDGRCACQKSLS